MLNNSKLHAITILALGGLLGYGAASGKLDVFRHASAESTQRHVSSLPLVPKPELGNEEGHHSPLTTQLAGDSCCSEGATKGQLLALADVKADDDVKTAKPDKGNEKSPAPGSPAATTTISGKYLPNAPPKFGGTIGL